MSKKTNSMYFENKETAVAFIKTLLDTSIDDQNNSLYCDIHVYQEEQAVIVEWEQIPFNHEYGGRFEYIDSDNDEEIMILREFPDGHYDYFHDEDEYAEMLDQWLEEHPGWKKSQYGRWYNESEVESL